MRRLILRSFQSPGDIVMLTAAVRDLHASHPGQFETDVRTSADALWENNPFITHLQEGAADVETLDMHYPLIHHSNQRPYHFLHGYPQYLEERLGVKIPVTQFKGDIHLSPSEKRSVPLDGHPLPDRYWIIVAGGKYDFTAKWWNPASYQKVVDHFQGTIHFVQVGESGHWHLPLTGVTNLIGKTSTRQFVNLMYHAEGVICPVTFAMHLAAAVETRPGRAKHRPCVVLAGGREPTHWEAYPHHQYLTTVGALLCCLDGGCWKSRCQPAGDGDVKDREELCEQPVQVTPGLRIPRCLDMITPEDVIRRVELYAQGGVLSFGTLSQNGAHESPSPQTAFQTASHDSASAGLVPGSPRWEQLPGLAREISVSTAGEFWCLGVTESTDGYSIHHWQSDHWERIEGYAGRIAAGVDGQPWIIKRNHQILSLFNGDWISRPGFAREIAVGSNGSVWCIGVEEVAPGGGSVHHWNGTDWIRVEGAAVKIAVDPAGEPWILNSAGQIFRRSGEGWELLPGLAKEIAIGPEGSVLCLSPGVSPDGAHSIHCWNGIDWNHIPGSASKLACDAGDRVYVTSSELAIFRAAIKSECL